jgi:hypothetical protein
VFTVVDGASTVVDLFRAGLPDLTGNLQEACSARTLQQGGGDLCQQRR